MVEAITLLKLPHHPNMVVQYVFPLVTGLGIIFGVLSFVAVVNNIIRQKSRGVYMFVLALANFFCLVLSLSEKWVFPVWGKHFPPLYLCNFRLFCVYLLDCVSTVYSGHGDRLLP